MRKGAIKEVLSKMLWTPSERAEEYLIIFISRGKPGDLESVRGDNVIKTYSSSIIIKTNEGIKIIPFSRIVEIKKGDKTIWRSSRWIS